MTCAREYATLYIRQNPNMAAHSILAIPYTVMHTKRMRSQLRHGRLQRATLSIRDRIDDRYA